jgi:hypothetical protein
MGTIVDAIRRGEPQLARPAFFPLVAYEAVKAISNPRRDYEQRLLAAYHRDLVKLRKQFGKQAEGLTLIGVDVPEPKVRWTPRGKEGNRLGYHNVRRSSLRVTSGGSETAIVIVSMISWRGEWYVVHLSGFE